MIQLKAYQERVLDSLRGFFKATVRDGRPDGAFAAVAPRSGGDGIYMRPSFGGLDEATPYVCLRVPTGGGKTLLACHAAGIAMKHFLLKDRAVVLWLVPSTAILSQTADALRDPQHSYRDALIREFGSVEVVTIEEALHLSRATVDGQTVVIVATIQAFRAEDTTGRKVYAQNGVFAEHLLNVPAARGAELLSAPGGTPTPSLVNALRLRRPIVIVDEAHNARTELSFEMLAAVKPSCIVEFTATPARRKDASNVLHRVSAAELKAEEMVKLPLRVVTRDPSQRDNLLSDAVLYRSYLEKLAGAEGQETGEYLRPILLVQAERVDACEPLREKLVADFYVPRETVRISVGGKNELADEGDLSSPSSNVRIVITVERLGEGWDCPFAYVLCSLKESRSATRIEQIVGRVLRLPGAKTKRHPELNCAYVFSVSPNILDVLAELRDALESNGFTAAEAARSVVVDDPQRRLPLWSSGQLLTFVPGTEIDAGRAAVVALDLSEKVRIDAPRGEVAILVPLDDAESERLTSCLVTEHAKTRVRAAVATLRAIDVACGGTGRTRLPSWQERGLPFTVPLLCVEEGQRLIEFDGSFLIDPEWRLSAKDAGLPGYDPRKRPTPSQGSVDVVRTGGTEMVVTKADAGDFVVRLHQQILDFGAPADWTETDLVRWLDAEIEHLEVPAHESTAFVLQAVRRIARELGIADIGVLVLDRFRLRDRIESRIKDHLKAERKRGWQRWLDFDPALQVNDACAVDFRAKTYAPYRSFEGDYVFRNHYFGPRPGDLRERTPAGALTEEFRCAQHIDNLTAVRCWVRNISRRPDSFRLQTSTDFFYPDFVCLLTDGRFLVVEFKGAHLDDGIDAAEKRAVGDAWEARSGGRGVFVMATIDNLTAIDEAIRRGQPPTAASR